MCKLIQHQSSILSCMMPLLLLNMGAKHRLLNALLCMVSTAHWWLVVLLQYGLMSCYWLLQCTSRPPLPWTLGLALVAAVFMLLLVLLSCRSDLAGLVGSPTAKLQRV